MVTPVERDHGLGPEAPEQLDLLLDPLAAVREVLAERLELDEVPAEADPEPEAPAGENVDLGGLLGDERGLPLREDEHAGDELEPGNDSGEVAEEDEDLVEHVLGRVWAGPLGTVGDVRAEYVVVRQQMGESELLGRLGVLADAARVSADLRLREDDSDLHEAMIPDSR